MVHDVRAMLHDVVTLLASPAMLFQSLRERPRWIGAVVTLIVVSAAAFFLARAEIAAYTKEAAVLSAREQNEASVAEIETFFESPLFTAVLVVSPVALTFLSIAIYSLVGLVLLAVTGGSEEPRPYGKLFQAALWAKLVEIPHLLLWTPLVLAKGSPEIFLGPAAIVTADPKSRLFSLMASFDLFHIWFIVLFVLGVRIMLAVEWPRAVLVAAVPWFSWQFLKLLWV
ncbi:MAG: hypothetical protein HKN20_00105 [Gemmatimonadetes bacterium]|nr:hypothetical protein [Gemmatimonadota bacterium]